MSKARDEETPEATVQRRQSDRLHKAKVRDEETPEMTAQRKQSNRLHMSKVRDEETPEATAQRKETNRLSMAKTRNEETDEQTTQRRYKDQDNKSLKRSRILTVEEAAEIFKSECTKQPVYICTCCHRLLWRKSMQKFKMDS